MKLLIVTQKIDQSDQLLGFFLSWIEKLAQKFEKVSVVCLEKREFSLPDNVTVFSLGKERGFKKLKQFFNFYFLIYKLRKEYQAVLVHMNPIWVVLGGLCWRLMDKKNYLWYNSGGVTFKLKLAEKLTHVILTASQESFRVPSKKVIVTGHGIDTNFFGPKTDYRPLTIDYRLKILTVGRIAPVKNYETLIEAAKILAERQLPFEVTIIGEAPRLEDKKYELEIRNKIKEFGLENYFKFLGKIEHSNLLSFYQSHNLFVHLSKTGSLDKSLLEAMASGIKVLSSNDWSRNNLPPELTFNENDPLELVNKIQSASQTDFREQLRNYVVKNHNLDSLIEKISKIIHEKNY